MDDQGTSKKNWISARSNAERIKSNEKIFSKEWLKRMAQTH